MAAENTGLIDLRWQEEVQALQQTADGVLLTVASPAGPYRLRAQWVIAADGAENVIAVVVALVEGRCSGAGGVGDAAHGERLFAAPGPQAAGRVKDALFELRIGLSGQRPASVRSESLRGPTALTT